MSLPIALIFGSANTYGGVDAGGSPTYTFAGGYTPNGTYIPCTGANATYNGTTQYTNGSCFIYWTSSSRWVIGTAPNATGTGLYYNSGLSTQIYLSGWLAIGGATPNPTAAQITTGLNMCGYTTNNVPGTSGFTGSWLPVAGLYTVSNNATQYCNGTYFIVYTSVQWLINNAITGGGTIYYVYPATGPIGSTVFPLSSTAYGRYAGTLPGPTFSLNSGCGPIIIPSAATPVITPATGTYTSIQSCDITCSTTGSIIYYTLNGATPTTSSSIFVSPFVVAVTETVQAIAVAPGYTNSNVASNTITINLPATNIYSSPTRSIGLQLKAVTLAGSLIMDLSNWLVSAQVDHSDQPESHKATFVLLQQNGEFDPLGGGTYDTILKSGQYLQYSIEVNGTWYSRYLGEIVEVNFQYERDKPTTVSVSCLDLAYKLLTATVTSNQFTNQQINLIASDLILQYGGYTNTDLAPLNLTVPTFQAPSLAIVDCLADLFGIANYFFWWNYSGVFSSSPRVGTGIVGLPDATVAPTPNITLPDNALIVSGNPSVKSYNTTNQVTVIGQALEAALTYGPVQLITQISTPDQTNFLAPKAGQTFNIQLSPTTGSSNVQTISGLYVKVISPSYNFQPKGYQYMCADPTAIDVNGIPVPLGPFDQKHSTSYGTDFDNPHIFVQKSDGRQEGDIFLNVNAQGMGNPGLTVWQTVPMFLDANSDGGGFDYCLQVYGKPVILQDLSITSILDYDPTYLTDTLMVDVFGDHKTYAVSDPANPSTTITVNVLVGGTSLTVVSAVGFAINGSVYLGTGSDFETLEITNIVGNVITVASPGALYAHTSGAYVMGTTTIQPLAMGTPVEVLVNTLPSTTLSAAATPVAQPTIDSSTPPVQQTITLTSATGFVVPANNPISINTMNNIRVGSNAVLTTTLASNASLGAISVVVTSATGLTIGAPIYINSSNAATYETNVIASITGTTIGLTTALINAHSSTEIFGTAPIYEYATIVAISGTTLVLANALNNSYAASVPVVGLTGVITADGLLISNLMRVDFEQGRVVFDDLTYNNFLEDDIATPSTPDTTYATVTDTNLYGLTVTGGNALPTIGNMAQNPPGTTFSSGQVSVLGIDSPAPTAVYTTRRQSANPKDGIGFNYYITGLEPGRGYTLRLHFMEYYFNSGGQRLFDVQVNGDPLLQDFDIYGNSGALYQVYIAELTGINAQADGSLTIKFINGQPGQNNGTSVLSSPIVQCVELIDPQGVGGAYPEINCGGPAITPTPPVVSCNAAYSANQRQFGIKKQEIDNPMLSTLGLCQQSGQYALNRSNWSTYPITITTAAFPTVTPAIIIKYFNPYCGPAGADLYMYIESIQHRAGRSASGNIAQDEYTGYTLFSVPR